MSYMTPAAHPGFRFGVYTLRDPPHSESVSRAPGCQRILKNLLTIS